MSIKKFLKQRIVNKMNREYDREAGRRYEDYDTWIRRTEEKCPEYGGLSREECRDTLPEFVCFDHQPGCFTEDADSLIGSYFALHPECMIVYGDEDILDQETGRRSDPWFKPDWSPDTFRFFDYLGNAVAVRAGFLHEPGFPERESSGTAERRSLEKCIRNCGGFEKNCTAIGHIGKILFHGTSVSGSQEPYFKRNEVREETGNPDRGNIPRVSVIIPSKDNVSVLKQCIFSVLRTVERVAPEIIVVDNGSSRESLDAVEKLKEELTEYQVPFHFLYSPMEFNFSAMCNLGARQAEGDYLLFLNDDTEAVQKGWLDRMCEQAAQTYTGAVGIKLLYPDNQRIQHAGVVNLPMGPVHKLQFLRDDREYYFGWNRGCRNVLAVTGACLMVRRSKFTEAGGFCEKLKIAFNDVALCFSLYELGYHNTVLNGMYLYHHESMSRGDDETEEKWKRLMKEREMLYMLHPGLKGKDPYYSVMLNRNGADTRILPGNEDFPDRPAKVPLKKIKKFPEFTRKDECLLIRFERMEEDCIQGYAVVLGSNNACYDKKMLLYREETAESGEEKFFGYEMALPPLYRSDLKENMSDQERVALCGFLVAPDGKPVSGQYRIGILARNRISGQVIFNESSRSLTVV